MINPDFQTERLTVTHWRDVLMDGAARARLEIELDPILTPTTTAFLPPSMAVDTTSDIAAWIDGRAGESDVCTVRFLDGTLVGLLILHMSGNAIRIGYLFGEVFWGRGVATELLQGLVAWCKYTGECYQLIGGVETDNTASVRVLEKVGFVRDGDTSTAINSYYHLQVG